MSPVEDKVYEVYDPSAGSGSLVLHLANELGEGSFGDKAQVYTQDVLFICCTNYTIIRPVRQYIFWNKTATFAIL